MQSIDDDSSTFEKRESDFLREAQVEGKKVSIKFSVTELATADSCEFQGAVVRSPIKLILGQRKF